MIEAAQCLNPENTRIIVDSSSNVPAAQQAQYRMLEVPTLVNFGVESFRNNVDLSAAEFYARFAAHPDDVPTTSQPPPAFFADAYRRAFDEGADHVIVVTITRKLSGTYNSAVSAAQAFGPERFLLWDGNTISMGSGWQALVAARLLEGGVSGADLVATLTRVRDAMVGYAALDTLKYAALSGRVGNVQAGLGNLLHIKPILELRDGRVDAVSRARGRKRSLREIVERFNHDLTGQPVNVAVQHANAADDAAALADELRQRLDVRELTSGDIGPAIAALGGPGAIGIIGFPAALAQPPA